MQPDTIQITVPVSSLGAVGKALKENGEEFTAQPILDAYFRPGGLLRLRDMAAQRTYLTEAVTVALKDGGPVAEMRLPAIEGQSVLITFTLEQAPEPPLTAMEFGKLQYLEKTVGDVQRWVDIHADYIDAIDDSEFGNLAAALELVKACEFWKRNALKIRNAQPKAGA